MDLDISGRVAIVSGSSKGLGKATALALAAEGVKLVMSARDEDRLRMAAAEVAEATGAEVLSVAADVSTAAGVDALMEATIQRFEHVDILVPNSGGPKLGSFSELTETTGGRRLAGLPVLDQDGARRAATHGASPVGADHLHPVQLREAAGRPADVI